MKFEDLKNLYLNKKKKFGANTYKHVSQLLAEAQECPLCHNISPDNRKTQEKFKCTSCGYTNNADLVAAINILAAGHAVSACGEAVHQDSSMNQEPARRVA